VNKMIVAILALQGAFQEHADVFHQLGVETIELRQKSDLSQPFDALVLPGGESTVQGQLLKQLDMFDLLQEKIRQGLPVLATCAGLILLANELTNDDRRYFQTLPIKVKRNAYGRQLGSFVTETDFRHIGNIEARFIRGPYIEDVDPDVEVLATVDEKIVAVQYHHQLAMAFHPELSDDVRIHQYFLSMIQHTEGL